MALRHEKKKGSRAAVHAGCTLRRGFHACHAGNSRASARWSAGSTSLRSDGRESLRRRRSTSGSHHSRSAPPGPAYRRAQLPARPRRARDRVDAVSALQLAVWIGRASRVAACDPAAAAPHRLEERVGRAGGNRPEGRERGRRPLKSMSRPRLRYASWPRAVRPPRFRIRLADTPASMHAPAPRARQVADARAFVQPVGPWPPGAAPPRWSLPPTRPAPRGARSARGTLCRHSPAVAFERRAAARRSAWRVALVQYKCFFFYVRLSRTLDEANGDARRRASASTSELSRVCDRAAASSRGTSAHVRRTLAIRLQR